MFRYFPTNYVWNRSVDLAIEMGARVGEIEEMCGPVQEAAKQPDGEGTRAFRDTWLKMADKLHLEHDAAMDLHDETWTARPAPLEADASQLFLFQRREKWAPSGLPPGANGNAH
jgi:hypothetical protein